MHPLVPPPPQSMYSALCREEETEVQRGWVGHVEPHTHATVGIAGHCPVLGHTASWTYPHRKRLSIQQSSYVMLCGICQLNPKNTGFFSTIQIGKHNASSSGAVGEIREPSSVLVQDIHPTPMVSFLSFLSSVRGLQIKPDRSSHMPPELPTYHGNLFCRGN